MNEWGFRPPLCTYRLNWAMGISWGWWDEWDDTALQTHDSKWNILTSSWSLPSRQLKTTAPGLPPCTILSRNRRINCILLNVYIIIIIKLHFWHMFDMLLAGRHIHIWRYPVYSRHQTNVGLKLTQRKQILGPHLSNIGTMSYDHWGRWVEWWTVRSFDEINRTNLKNIKGL